MYRNKGGLSLILVLLAFSLPVTVTAQDEVRRSLEDVYAVWRKAMRDKNYEAWVGSTAAFRQGEVRNAIVSQGGEFPEALFEVPLAPPDIRGLDLLDARVVGFTAYLIYFGQVDLGHAEGEVPENVLVLSFVVERAGGWRFDSTRLVNLAGLPEVRADIKAGRLDFLKAPEFTPTGRVPAVPPPCPKPDYFGRIDVAANGYAVTLRLNGFVYPAITNTGKRNVVIGGFKEGENKLEMTIRPVEIPEGEERILEVGAFASRTAHGGEVSEVFRWKPEGEVPDRYENPIWVTKDRVD